MAWCYIGTSIYEYVQGFFFYVLRAYYIVICAIYVCTYTHLVQKDKDEIKADWKREKRLISVLSMHETFSV
jgi:hypothetical protein